MGTRTFAQVPPTSATIALNAYIFGYAGHSLVTPHHALKQLWWTNDRIDAKVTRRFVVSKLRGEEREYLDKPLGFGEGLTDDTYMEWILERARRLFLVLTEVGVPDRILGAIDDSWQDEDLPIAREDVKNLELAIENDESLNKRFYDLQFLYLLRQLDQGSHIDYGPREHIPMEYIFKLPPAASLQSWDRVHFPGKPDEVFMRRKFSFGVDEFADKKRLQFLRDIQRASDFQHEHIVPIWASYTAEKAGHVLSNFVAEHTVKTFIAHRTPPQFLRVKESDRPVVLVEWMHCLADAVASLHHRGSYHGSIRPSNILIDHDNHIAFADIGHLKTFQTGKKTCKEEVHDYSAPEVCFGQTSRIRVVVPSCADSTTNDLWPRTILKDSPVSDKSYFGSQSPKTPSSGDSPQISHSASFRNFSRHLQTTSEPGPNPRSPSLNFSPPGSPLANAFSMPFEEVETPATPRRAKLRDLPVATPQAADVFSLGCVFLDIATFLIKGKLNDFVKFRSVRVKSTNSGAKRSKATTDSAFHADTAKIDSWMTLLRDDALKRSEAVFRAIPELLKLVRRMLVQNAELRPSAREVRDRIEDILASQCGIETLCCAGREWEALDEGKVSQGLRDSMSVATSATWKTARSGSSGDAASVLTRPETRSETKSVKSVKSMRNIRSLWKKKTHA